MGKAEAGDGGEAPWNHALLEELGERLEARASAETRSWWERYLKGAATFRGVRMADVRAEVHDWYALYDLGTRPAGTRAALALDLIRRSPTEDKLAGILLLREFVLPSGAPSWRALLPAFETLFEEGALADWNAVDWFCVKVLAALVARDGGPCARAVAAWRDAPGLWQRRASAVAFVPLVGRPDPSPLHLELALRSCERLVADRQRFSQTAAAWVLRDISLASPDGTASFVRRHAGSMSREAVRRATERLELGARAELLGLHAAGRKGG